MSSSRILAYPSVSSSLNDLQYATNMSNIPLHGGPNARIAESADMLKRAVSHNGGPHKTPVLAAIPPNASQSNNPDVLTMRSRK
ncbi:hypothetical protein RhiJN_21484 [Ceratobasidium sp. AG-Ba]|nr:hypothetical protein RhiJN_21484 [Ceratobasidium sp. AG-Ba]